MMSNSKILPTLRSAIASKAEDFLIKVGITVIKNARVKTVIPEDTGTIVAKATVTFKIGKTLKADLYIPTTGIRPNTSFIQKELLTADGRVNTNTSTLCVDKTGSRIYAIGDAAPCARPAVHILLDAISALCANITRFAAGR
jgi:apoptosis-inducing factor 2